MTVKELGFSVVVPSIEEWPNAKACLDSIHGQLDGAGGEIVVATRHTMPAAARKRYPRATWIHIDGASVFELRARGIEAARGTLVLVTEDHCVVAPTWCAGYLATFKDPRVEWATGPGDNGTRDRATDWGSFLIAWAKFMPGGRRLPIVHHLPVGNGAFRRRLAPAPVPTFWYESGLGGATQGARIAWAEESSIAHFLAGGMAKLARHHYHNARATAPLLHRTRAARVGAAAANLLLLPLQFVVIGSRELIRRNKVGLAVRSAPAVFVCGAATGWGRFVGSIAGPGHSPLHVD